MVHLHWRPTINATVKNALFQLLLGLTHPPIGATLNEIDNIFDEEKAIWDSLKGAVWCNATRFVWIRHCCFRVAF